MTPRWLLIPVVIVVVFDEFPVDSLRRPDGRIDAARYPAFGRQTILANLARAHEF
jgi:hypothetical protein